MAKRRMGVQTVGALKDVRIVSRASVAGRKEEEGPLGGAFDKVMPDELDGEKSWEACEKKMFADAVRICAQKAELPLEKIHYLLGGDLLNQIISAGFAARELKIPFLGLYGACSTMAESLSIGAMLVEGGFADRLMCATCSHFCTAERQYRAPLELGNQRTPSAQWTVTGAGAVMLAPRAAAPQARVALTHVTTGRVTDLGISDANNMGAAMAPAAVDTLLAHFRDTGRSAADYDLIVTGDLGTLGRKLMLELLEEKGVHIPEKKSFDCGAEIYAPEQDTHAGGSGCGCSASVLCAHLLPLLEDGHIGRILFMATGALLSTTTTMQGESIPAIAHAVSLERIEKQKEGAL